MPEPTCLYSPASRIVYHAESEDEDQPRDVLDIDGDFTFKDAGPNIRFKLRGFNPQVEDSEGRMVPFPGVLAIRLVPKPADVAHAKAAMGQGHLGVWTGTRFEAPDSPAFVFAVRPVNCANPGFALERFCIRRRFVPWLSMLKTMMIYTDGACSHNGSTALAPRGGSAFVFNNSKSGTEAFALEKKGPDGQTYAHTSNRAELRAVIAALQFRVWWGEGWQRIVMVTDSEYVGKGATEWLRNWAGKNWRTAGSKPVANQDLWKALSDSLGTYAEAGCEISFWIVPRDLNGLADAAAKGAAEKGQSKEKYMVTHGVMV
ncbi:ribonuclease H-like protein [Whalleya microplaca]|nr:ribonuclease H-like protein [Whalleya microplaca]